MNTRAAAFLHYSAPPVVGGVEAVMEAHARTFLRHGIHVAVIAGQGSKDALPEGCLFELIPELSSQHPRVLAISAELEAGRVPEDFEPLVNFVAERLRPLARRYPRLIVHNLFTKHFNLPLTAALFRLLDEGLLRGCLAWCHDFTWTSPGSRHKVHAGYPWDLLRTYREDLTYVTVSQARQVELAGLLQIPAEKIRVVYNGVDAGQILGLSAEGQSLAARLGMAGGWPVLLMPVRVTRAKNIELALRVVAEMKAQHRSPRCVVTGPPDPHSPDSLAYYQSLRDLRREMGLEKELRFVYESGPGGDEAYVVPLERVGELYRLADVIFMPSQREGFGMPVVEAGLAGVPAAASRAVPAAVELDEGDLFLFEPDDPPGRIARSLLHWLEEIPTARFRRRVRAGLTWEAIFAQEIRPLLEL